METPAKKLAELTQTAYPFRRQTLVLHEDRLDLDFRGPMERYRIPFYLHSLKEEPDQVMFVPWKKILLWSVMLGTGLVLLLTGTRDADAGAGIGLLAAGAAGLIHSLLLIQTMLVYFFKSAGDFGRYEPQLWLYPGRPSTEEVKRFAELLKLARDKQVQKARIEQEDMIPYARELERFANLHEESVLTEDEYRLVKAKLLNLKPKKIGF